MLDYNYFIDNEYLDLYRNLITANLNTPNIKYKTQSHHIVPRIYYKLTGKPIDNSKSNLVNLLYKDHLMAHYYLCLCAKDEALKLNLAFAFSKMCDQIGIKEEIDFIQLDHYQELYELRCKKASLDKIGKKASEETKTKMRKPKSEETKLKISQSRKGVPNPKSGETRKGVCKPEVSIKLKNKRKDANSKYFNIYCLELNKLFLTTYDIKMEYPELDTKKIILVLSGKLKTHHNMHWCCGFNTKEESKNYLLELLSKPVPHKNSNQIQNLETGKLYNSISEAEIEYSGRVTGNIMTALKNKRKAYGTYWASLQNHNGVPYTEDESKALIEECKNILKEKRNKDSKCISIICLNDGKIFDSVKEAELFYFGKYTCRIQTAIQSNIDGTTGGYKFRYLDENKNNTIVTRERKKPGSKVKD